MRLDLRNAIVIIDEAHNVASAAESAESIEINCFTLAQAEYELQEVIIHLLESEKFIFKVFQEQLNGVKDLAGREKLIAA